MDVVGFYTNIPLDEGLPALRQRLDERDKKDVCTDTLVKLAELVLKIIFLVSTKKLSNKEEAQQLGQSLLYPIVFYLWQICRKNFSTIFILGIYR